MSESPSNTGGDLVTLSLFSGDKAVRDTVQVVSVEVVKKVNRVPLAKILLADGDMPDKDFPLSNEDTFQPGAEIRIAAGYGADEQTIFEGIVVRHGLSVSGENVARLVVECRDKAVAMTIGRRNATYVNLKDSDVIGRLVARYGGLSSDVADTGTSLGELVQYYCTDWDFMLARAEVNGFLVVVDAAKVTVGPPDTQSDPALRVTYGEDLMEIEAHMDARSQLTSVTGTAWSPRDQKVVAGEAPPVQLNHQGNLTGATLAKVAGPESYRLQTAAALDADALKGWTRAQQVKAGLARVRGSMRFQGSAKAEVGSMITLEGVGERFEGEVFVTGVRHRVADGAWTTEAEFGLDPAWFTERTDVVAPPASGWTAGIEGLQIGIVDKLDENPDGEPMVRVRVPVLQSDDDGVWARLAHPYASSGVGSFFVPEIGDEVVLGHLSNDPSYPVILGAFYSSKRAPPYDMTADNFTKAIVTKSQLRLEFDDDKKVITVVTPAGNKAVLSDDDESILLQDQSGNKVELSSSGIVLDSPKDVSITASGKLTLSAVGALAASSKADVKVSGMNVSNEADVGFTAKGNATAELSASGQTTVKGAMVMIN